MGYPPVEAVREYIPEPGSVTYVDESGSAAQDKTSNTVHRRLVSPAAWAGAPYASGKAGTQGLILTLALELKGGGVNANSIWVGAVDAAHQCAQTPTPKNANWASPEDKVETMVYLSSDDTPPVNGAQLPRYRGLDAAARSLKISEIPGGCVGRRSRRPYSGHGVGQGETSTAMTSRRITEALQAINRCPSHRSIRVKKGTGLGLSPSSSRTMRSLATSRISS
jgi:hypothetical protein